MKTLPKIERIDCDSEAFPENLKVINSKVKQLYCCGNIELLQKRSVAVVGSRKYSVYGRSVARLLGQTLAQGGVPVVSGLAKGIDSFAHEGTITAEGMPIAVLGTGIMNMYPMCNLELMHQVAETGLVISEYEPNFRGMKGTFPARNRIIAGLAEAIVVVEGGINSGALITAQFANEQGKSVYAVPGNINSQFSAGTNMLIRDGAIPLIVLSDILQECSGTICEEKHESVNMDDDEIKIYKLVNKYNGIYADEISRNLGISAGKVNAVATVMEMKGLIMSMSGKYFSCKNLPLGL